MAREAIIQEDTIIKGKIRNCRQMEIYGFVEGELAAEVSCWSTRGGLSTER